MSIRRWRRGRHSDDRRPWSLLKEVSKSGSLLAKVTVVPLYSRKLHMRVRRDSTSWVTSLMILAFSLGERVVNHLARRCEENLQSVQASSSRCVHFGVGHETNHFALPRQENQIAGLESKHASRRADIATAESHWIAMVSVKELGRVERGSMWFCCGKRRKELWRNYLRAARTRGLVCPAATFQLNTLFL